MNGHRQPRTQGQRLTELIAEAIKAVETCRSSQSWKAWLNAIDRLEEAIVEAQRRPIVGGGKAA